MDEVEIKLKLIELIYKHGSRKDSENIYDKVDEMFIYLNKNCKKDLKKVEKTVKKSEKKN